MKELSQQDIHDILTGSTILGTGGGGEIEEGLEYIAAATKAGKSFRLASVSELAPDSMICTPYLLGALKPSDSESTHEYARLPKSETLPIMAAFRRLETYTGKQFHGTIPCELGGANTALAAYVAAMADGCLLDADVAGRAVPEITHSTYYFNGLDAAPAIVANEFGECFICENMFDDQRAEHVVRALAMVSCNDVSVIDHAMELRQVSGSVIKGTISKALELGAAFRVAIESGSDTASEIARIGNGAVVFRGEVSHTEYWDDAGFTKGEIRLQGTQDFSHSEYKIGVKNENLISWQNGELHATIPDLIIVVDLESDTPLTNPNVTPGMNCAVVVLPPPDEFLTDKALSVFGPSYLGLDTPYRSVLRR